MNMLFLLVLSQAHRAISNDWDDPHDMVSGAKRKLQENLKKSSSSPDVRLPPDTDSLDSALFNIHFKRLISLLMNTASIDKSDPTLFSGHIMFRITPIDFKYLLNINHEDLDADILRRIDTIFSESFSKTLVETYLENLMSVQNRLYAAIVNVHNLWLLGSCFMLYVVYQLFRTNFSFAYIAKYLVIVVFVVDFGLRYKVLLEEAEEHNLNVNYSPLCDTGKMGWSDYLVFLTSSRDCERRTATPLDAFLYQVKCLIIVPMHAFGTGMGGFVMNMYKTTPWGMGLLLLAIMLIFSLAIFIFLMAFMTDKAIEFNCFHLLKLKFGAPGTRESMLTGKTVERLIDRVIHRPMVQDVRAAGDPGAMIPQLEDRKDVAALDQAERSETTIKQNPANDKKHNKLELELKPPSISKVVEKINKKDSINKSGITDVQNTNKNYATTKQSSTQSIQNLGVDNNLDNFQNTQDLHKPEIKILEDDSHHSDTISLTISKNLSIQTQVYNTADNSATDSQSKIGSFTEAHDIANKDVADKSVSENPEKSSSITESYVTDGEDKVSTKGTQTQFMKYK